MNEGWECPECWHIYSDEPQDGCPFCRVMKRSEP